MSQLTIQNARWIAANFLNKVHFSFLQILQILVVKYKKKRILLQGTGVN